MSDVPTTSEAIEEKAAEIDLENTAQLVVFVMHEDLVASPIQNVVEIIKPLPLTRMPRTPDYVEGILNLRGQVFPVINLKRRLGLPESKQTERTRIIKAEVDGEPIGMIVDQVKEVLRVRKDQVDEPPAMMEESTGLFLNGVVRAEEGMILLLNMERLFESITNDAFGGAAAPVESGGDAEEMED